MTRCWKRPQCSYVRIKYLGTSWVSYSMLKKRHKEKQHCVVCQKEISKTSNLLRLHQTGATLLGAHAQVTEKLLPRFGRAPRVLLRNIGTLLD
jgi:hypothetical protein